MSTKRFAAFALMCFPAFAQGNYFGLQTLTRGGSGTGGRGAETVGFTFYAGVSGSYETGLVPASVDAEGNILNPHPLIGVIANLGAYGRHSWKRTTLILDYSGNFRHYPNNSYSDGSDHAFGLSVATQISRRLQLNSRTSVGSFAQYYLGGGVIASDLISAPTSGIFNNRATFLETSGGFVYNFNPRFSFNGSGTGFTIARQAHALVGLNGYSAQGDLGYRISKRRTIDFAYVFSHFDYSGGFGQSDIHNYSIGLTQQLGKRWRASVSGGVARVSTVGIEQVAADPITAALFGTPVTSEVFARDIMFGTGRASVSGTFRRSRVDFSYSQMPSAGNGVYLTSKQDSASSSYSYTGLRKASLSVMVNYSRMSSVGQAQLGNFTYVDAGVSTSYRLLRTVEASLQYNARNVQIDQSTGFARLAYRVMFGFNFHPGEIPITFW